MIKARIVSCPCKQSDSPYHLFPQFISIHNSRTSICGQVTKNQTTYHNFKIIDMSNTKNKMNVTHYDMKLQKGCDPEGKRKLWRTYSDPKKGRPISDDLVLRGSVIWSDPQEITIGASLRLNKKRERG